MDLSVVRATILCLSAIFILSQCNKPKDDPQKEITGSFEVQYDKTGSLPIKVTIKSNIQEAGDYTWTFPGGNPSSSTEAQPGPITYSERGVYQVFLHAKNNSYDLYLDKQINLREDIVVDFDFTFNEKDHSIINITNNTVGATNYIWEIPSANNYHSSTENPQNIKFWQMGDFEIKLTAYNEADTVTKSKDIRINTPLAKQDFYLIQSGNEPPVELNISGMSFTDACPMAKWTFTGGDPEISTEFLPENIMYNTKGVFEVKVELSNFDSTLTYTRTFHLGSGEINTFTGYLYGIDREDGGGICFSTTTGKSYEVGEYGIIYENTNVDIAFIGMDGMMFFCSPDEVTDWGATAIPEATHTHFINNIALKGITMTSETFDNMTDDSFFADIEIAEDDEAIPAGGTPIYVLFKNARGKKGIIQISDYQKGINGHVLITVKVQK